MTEIKIRACTADDAEAVGRLASQFHAYLNQLGDPTKFFFNATTYLRDGFGDDPAFIGFVAESDNGEVVGYILLHFGYDTDNSRRYAYVIDLFVHESSRGHGVGRALMTRAAETAQAHGAQTLWWGVYERNQSAIQFYESIGSQQIKGIRLMSIDVNSLSPTETDPT